MYISIERGCYFSALTGIVPFTGLHTALARYNVLNVVGYNVCM